jgi:hypothetical protein
MPQVVPSDVVAMLDRLFPQARPDAVGRGEFNTQDQGRVAAMLALIERLPPEFLTVSGEEYGAYQLALGVVRSTLNIWETQRAPHVSLVAVPGLTGRNPFSVIREILGKCPDEVLSPGTVELAFVDDADLREVLRQDVSSVNRALANAEWKAATVLGGSVVEALLLWALRRADASAVAEALRALQAENVVRKERDATFKWWGLHEFTEVAARMAIVSEETAMQARLTKDFRNLIHPERELRLGQKTSRRTALTAVAVMEAVVEDLGRRAAAS